MSDKCKWEKTIKGYVTLCGHALKMMGRGYIYCPYCGKELDKARADYLHSYYKNHAGKQVIR
jgi:hypothetical protein